MNNDIIRSLEDWNSFLEYKDAYQSTYEEPKRFPFVVIWDYSSSERCTSFVYQILDKKTLYNYLSQLEESVV